MRKVTQFANDRDAEAKHLESKVDDQVFIRFIPLCLECFVHSKLMFFAICSESFIPQKIYRVFVWFSTQCLSITA